MSKYSQFQTFIFASTLSAILNDVIRHVKKSEPVIVVGLLELAEPKLGYLRSVVFVVDDPRRQLVD